MNKYLILIILPLFVGSCAGESGNAEVADVETVSSTVEAAQTPFIHTIKSEEAKRLLAQGGITLLDIRTTQEWAGGHLQGAQHLDYYSDDFSSKLQTLDRTNAYLLYCAVGGRSREAARLMQQLGFQRVYDATEGFAGLKRAGVPVE